jgi:hypothetical protein
MVKKLQFSIQIVNKSLYNKIKRRINKKMAFDFYFAGSQSPETEQLMRSIDANILRSYLNDKRSIENLIKYKRDGSWKGKLLIDSGAFTAHRKDVDIDVDAYIQFLNNNNDAIDYAIQLDHIPGKWGRPKTPEEVKSAPIKTWENYLYMRQRLTRPDMLLPVFHMYEDFCYLRQILDFRSASGEPIKYMCISGSKEVTSQQRKAWYGKVFNVVKTSTNPNIKIHCLGSATRTDMEDFPFTSSDATSWIMTSSVGDILTPYGTVCVSKNKVGLKEHICNQPVECQVIIKNMCDKYGINYEDMQTDYKARSNFNVMYLTEVSKTTVYKQKRFNKGGLLV